MISRSENSESKFKLQFLLPSKVFCFYRQILEAAVERRFEEVRKVVVGKVVRTVRLANKRQETENGEIWPRGEVAAVDLGKEFSVREIVLSKKPEIHLREATAEESLERKEERRRRDYELQKTNFFSAQRIKGLR